MEEEVRFIESNIPKSDKANEDVAVVSSTTNHPGGTGSNTVNTPVNIQQQQQQQQKSKYSQLLAIIGELGKDICPTYAGSRSSAERLKRGIVYARILVRECLMETERNSRT